jgi:hypothetical protein
MQEIILIFIIAIGLIGLGRELTAPGNWSSRESNRRIRRRLNKIKGGSNEKRKDAFEKGS